MLTEKIRGRIDKALKPKREIDWLTVDVDRLFDELFPDEITRHDFRSVAEERRAEQVKKQL